MYKINNSIDSHAERVGATLAVALNQGGGKPRPYNVGILSYMA